MGSQTLTVCQVLSFLLKEVVDSGPTNFTQHRREMSTVFRELDACELRPLFECRAYVMKTVLFFLSRAAFRYPQVRNVVTSRNLFWTFSEVNGVSSIVKLFLTFWKVKSGKGGVQRSPTQKAAAKAAESSSTKKQKQQHQQQEQHKQQQKLHKQHKQQRKLQKQQQRHEGPESGAQSSLWVLTGVFSKNFGSVFEVFFEISVIFITIGS